MTLSEAAREVLKRVSEGDYEDLYRCECGWTGTDAPPSFPGHEDNDEVQCPKCARRMLEGVEIETLATEALAAIADDGWVSVEPEVMQFAQAMQKQLDANKERGDWKEWDYATEDGPYAIKRNLKDFKFGDKKSQTCADIANFALMMWWQAKG